MLLFKSSIKIAIPFILCVVLCFSQTRSLSHNKPLREIKKDTNKLISLYNLLDKGTKHNWNYKDIHKKYKEELKFIIKTLPLEIKLGQIFICWPSISNNNSNLNLGGFVFSHSHIPSIEKVISNTEELNKKAYLPLIFAIDQEGGKVNRLKKIDEYQDLPSAMEIGLWSAKKIKEYSDIQGKILKKMNFNTNLAPVLDISIDGFMFETQRSFSADSNLVIKAGKAFADGMRLNNILCIAKHFPGYGNTEENSDLTIAYSKITKDSLRMYIDIFKALKDKIQGVMMSHIIYQSEDNLPASASPKFIKIAKSINPNWLIISDFVESQAILDFHNNNLPKAIAGSFLAGNDLIISNRPPRKIEKYIDDIIPFVKNDKKFNSRLNESVEKVLVIKEMIYPGMIVSLYSFLKNK